MLVFSSLLLQILLRVFRYYESSRQHCASAKCPKWMNRPSSLHKDRLAKDGGVVGEHEIGCRYVTRLCLYNTCDVLLWRASNPIYREKISPRRATAAAHCFAHIVRCFLRKETRTGAFHDQFSHSLCRGNSHRAVFGKVSGKPGKFCDFCAKLFLSSRELFV